MTPFMLETSTPLFIAFAVTAIGAVGLRFALGAERATRWAGAFVGIGFLAALIAMPGFAWTAFGAVNRIGHILIGAIVVGAVLVFFKPARLWQWIILGVFALGCGWASAVNGLLPKVAPTPWQVGLTVGLACVWLGMMVRFSAAQTHKPSSLVVLIAVIAGLAIISSLLNDILVPFIAQALLAAVFAYAVFSVVFRYDLTEVLVVPVASSIVAIAWSISQRHQEALVGLGILALVLFAERTARRVPLPKSGIAGYLYLAILAGCCAIPVIIAAVLVSASAGA
jgi:hypothetical protein